MFNLQITTNFSKGGEKVPYSYNKLRGRIVETYGSQKEFAKVLGLSENSLSKKMNGKTGFSQEDIITWSNLLDIEPGDYNLYFFT